jgi:hypothetical protein
VNEVSLLRLYLMRAAYLLLVVGLGLTIWPGLIHHATPWTSIHGVAASLLAALSVLAVFGLRYPLAMLPVLVFELLWKAIWLITIGLPLWSAHRMDAETWNTAYTCLAAVVVFPFVIPWPHVFAHYLRASGDRWR